MSKQFFLHFYLTLIYFVFSFWFSHFCTYFMTYLCHLVQHFNILINFFFLVKTSLFLDNFINKFQKALHIVINTHILSIYEWIHRINWSDFDLFNSWTRMSAAMWKANQRRMKKRKRKISPPGGRGMSFGTPGWQCSAPVVS